MRKRGVITDVSNIETPAGSLAIPLTNGRYSLVDIEDYSRVVQYRWLVNNKGYAYGIINKKPQLMHRLIMNVTDPKKLVDHKFHDLLDNRKAFLRICNRSQNGMNRKRNKKSSSRFKGVYFYKRDSNWHAQISLNGKQMSLGFFDDEIEAAKAYDNKAQELFGDFALLNFKITTGGLDNE